MLGTARGVSTIARRASSAIRGPSFSSSLGGVDLDVHRRGAPGDHLAVQRTQLAHARRRQIVGQNPAPVQIGDVDEVESGGLAHDRELVLDPVDIAVDEGGVEGVGDRQALELTQVIPLQAHEARPGDVQIRIHAAEQLILAEVLAPVDDEAHGQKGDHQHRKQHQDQQLVTEVPCDLELEGSPHGSDPDLRGHRGHQLSLQLLSLRSRVLRETPSERAAFDLLPALLSSTRNM